MKMRNLFLTTLFAMIATVGFSQNVQPSGKVLQGFDKTKLRSLTESDLAYWNFYSDNAYFIHDEAKSKDGVKMLSTVIKTGSNMDMSSLSNESFNPFLFNVQPDVNESKFYLIDGTNKVVQFFSQERIDDLYHSYQINEAKKVTKK